MNRDHIRDLRNEYGKHGLSESEVSHDPFVQFGKWFDDCMEAKIEEPNAMTLSTATNEGRVSSRIVLLKGFDSKGFIFYTNYHSRKGNEIAQNRFGALNFFWKELERQVRIEGRIEKISEQASTEYFNSRPVGSRLGAWTSNQSEVIPDRKFLEEKYSEVEKKFSGVEIPKPLHWGGYILVPDYFEYWQGKQNRLHDRIRYVLSTDNWRIERLAP